MDIWSSDDFLHRADGIDDLSGTHDEFSPEEKTRETIRKCAATPRRSRWRVAQDQLKVVLAFWLGVLCGWLIRSAR